MLAQVTKVRNKRIVVLLSAWENIEVEYIRAKIIQTIIIEMKKNPLNKGYRIIHCGYYWVLAPNHPFACHNGRIREHRLIAEQHYLTEENSVEINGKRYLSLEYDVHHIDGNKLNNDYKNLMVVTRSEHMKIHQKLKRKKKQKLSS